MRRTFVAVSLGLAVLPAAVARAQPRELHWRALSVSAHLTPDGRLRVRERHAMVFTGDWNGGERTFELKKGQALQFHRLSRVRPGGALEDLRERTPPAVDEYTWAGPTVLRWRSRAPADPPFRGQEITYELEYTLSGVLRAHDGVYRLDHDFGVPSRPGPIERLTLDLSFDPALQPTAPLAMPQAVGRLAPGAGYRVAADFRIQGATVPAGAEEPLVAPALWAIAGALALAVVGASVIFWRGEAAAGRLEPLVARDRIDERWLTEHVFRLPAEVVGAIWDRAIGGHEVAATLARLEVEAKVETWSDPHDSSVRHLKLLVEPTALRGHERFLLDALLVDGGRETDTARVKKHYESVGFNPASVIEKPLEKEVRAVLGHDRHLGGASTFVAVTLLGGVAVLCYRFVTREDVYSLLVAAALLPVFLFGLFFAFHWRYDVGGRAGAAARFLLPVAVLPALLAAAIVQGYLIEPPAAAGVALIALSFAAAILNLARTRESAAAMRIRKRLTSAERYLGRALRDGSAAVKPTWFPHLLALGLADDANRWSAARPASDTIDSTGWSGTSDRGSSAGTRTETFSPGGGRFGGAGASGAWGGAAMAFSASVAAPSSSSSDGGGSSSSSSSSSSGGGGAGGW